MASIPGSNPSSNPSSSPSGALALALETSTRRPSIALRIDGRWIEKHLEGSRAHASDLLPSVIALLEEAGCAPRDLREIHVGLGPGSYTGLRVGIATAQGLARGTGALTRGLPSPEALAHGELEVGQSAWWLQDARQGQVYCAHYSRRASNLHVERAPCVLRTEDFPTPTVFDPTGAPHRIFGDATIAKTLGLDDSDAQRIDTTTVPGAAALGTWSSLQLQAHGPTDPRTLDPLYLRPFAARPRAR